jgi:hypothetical protein
MEARRTNWSLSSSFPSSSSCSPDFAVKLNSAFNTSHAKATWSSYRHTTKKRRRRKIKEIYMKSNKSPTRCNNFSVYYPDVYLQLNMFRAFSHPSSVARWMLWEPPVLPSHRGDSRAVFVVGPAGRPARPQTQHDCHHDTKVKPEAATAVIELLMMGRKTPETCWAVNKRQDNKLKNCCIWLVIYLNCTMMHGLTNLKFT